MNAKKPFGIWKINRNGLPLCGSIELKEFDKLFCCRRWHCCCCWCRCSCFSLQRFELFLFFCYYYSFISLHLIQYIVGVILFWFPYFLFSIIYCCCSQKCVYLKYLNKHCRLFAFFALISVSFFTHMNTRNIWIFEK